MAASQKLHVEVAKSFRASLDQAKARGLGVRAVEAIEQAARLVAIDFANDNPRFDEARFYIAVGLVVTAELETDA